MARSPVRATLPEHAGPVMVSPRSPAGAFTRIPIALNRPRQIAEGLVLTDAQTGAILEELRRVVATPNMIFRVQTDPTVKLSPRHNAAGDSRLMFNSAHSVSGAPANSAAFGLDGEDDDGHPEPKPPYPDASVEVRFTFPETTNAHLVDICVATWGRGPSEQTFHITGKTSETRTVPAGIQHFLFLLQPGSGTEFKVSVSSSDRWFFDFAELTVIA
jgi:hypothetical protein